MSACSSALGRRGRRRRRPPGVCGAADARATAGWRGSRAHYIQLLGFATLMINIFVIQIFITGMHSYAGVGK